MLRWFVLFSLTLSTLAFSKPIYDRRLDPDALAQLTSQLGISSDADLIAETQKRWLRKPNQERWEMIELSIDDRTFVLNWGAEQELFAEWAPSQKQYDKAIILGATTSRMEKRLNYLIQLWESGVRFQEVVWLTGERPLDPKVDNHTDRCRYESEAAYLIWEQTSLPEEMRYLPALFVSAPAREGSKRPNTQDTIHAWLQSSPEPCQALFISEQPFCGYQFAIVKQLLPDSFAYEIAGPSVISTEHPAAAAIFLDTIARWIYAENDVSILP